MTGDIGKIYADALFQLCKEDNSLDEAFENLSQCSKIFAENSELLKIMSAPTVTVSEKKDILSKLFSDCGMVYNLLCILAEKNRASYICQIADSFSKLYNDFNNIAEMTVITCVPLSSEMRSKMIEKLSKKFNKKVKLNEKVDKSIIGGVIVQYGNMQMDNSVRTKLNSVKKELKI